MAVNAQLASKKVQRKAMNCGIIKLINWCSSLIKIILLNFLKNLIAECIRKSIEF